MKRHPLVKTVKSPRNYYLYDTNKNDILPIDAETFDFLNGKIPNYTQGNSPTLVNDLLNAGYLCDSNVHQCEHPSTPDLPVLLERRVKKITLQLTQQCNFRCKYCIYTRGEEIHQRSHSSQKMDWETAKQCLNFAISHSVDCESLNVGFYGGEPLLEFNLIKKCVNYLKEECPGKLYTFTVTTNGTLLTDEIVQFFIDNNFSLVISLDGPKTINDTNRVFAGTGQGTFDAVIKKLLHIKDIFPDFMKQIQISMVLNPHLSFDKICELNFEALGISPSRISVSMVDIGRGKVPPDPSPEFIAEYNYSEFLGFLSYLKLIPSGSVPTIIESIVGEFIARLERRRPSSRNLGETAAPSGPCIPGQSRLFATVNGSLYPCERVSETSSIMNLGSVYTEIDVTKASTLLNVGKLTSNECKNCWGFRLCTVCAKAADDGNRLSPDLKTELCSNSLGNAYKGIRTEILIKEAPVIYALSFKGRNL